MVCTPALKSIKVLQPFEVADLISFYQSDNVMPKGEAEEISKASSMAKYLWNNRQHFRKNAQCFKQQEDTIFRPVAPFNVLTREEADDYLSENNLAPPTDAYAQPKTATVFTVSKASSLDPNRKITVRVTTMGGKNFKLRLPRNQFNYDLLKMKLSSAGVEHLHLYLKGRMNDKDKVPVQNEEAFQRVLEQAFKAKRPLELVMDRRRATKKRRRTSMYEEPVPRKKVKQDLNPYASTGGLMEASRKKRESRRQKERESRKTQIVEPEPEPAPQPRQQKQKQEEVQDDICRVCGSYWVKNRWHLDTDWLCCDFCGGWFHVHCLGMLQSEFKTIVENKQKFKCSQCEKKSKQKDQDQNKPAGDDWVYF